MDTEWRLIVMPRLKRCRRLCLRSESKALGDSWRERGFPITNFGELRYVTWGGGVPVTAADGEVVGAVGVSGLSEDEDTALARMAAGRVPRG